MRFRLTATVTVAAAIVFTAGAVFIFRMVDQAVVDEARTADRAFLKLLATTHDAQLPLTPIDDPSEDTPEYAVATRDGEIVYTTPGFPTELPPSPGFDIQVEETQSDSGGRQYIITRIAGADREVIFTVARPLDEVGKRVAELGLGLIFLVPTLVAMAGIASWYLTGRALQPVSALTERAAEISATDLGDRLPVPATNDEISHLAVTLNQLLARTDHASRQQRQFIADASHELRSPITAISSHLQLARANPAITDWDQLLEIIGTQNARLGDLVADLVDLARLDENPAASASELVDLDDLILANLPSSSRELDIDLNHLSAGQVHGDKRLLQRLIRNTIDNAYRHARRRIAITLATSAGAVTYAIDDDGPGINIADRRRVFERFVRLDTARSRGGGGTGLGLAIAQAVARAHNATIEATDSPLGGARIEVRFRPTPNDKTP